MKMGWDPDHIFMTILVTSFYRMNKSIVLQKEAMPGIVCMHETLVESHHSHQPYLDNLVSLMFLLIRSFDKPNL